MNKLNDGSDLEPEANDHYISQTYLKQFSTSQPKDRMVYTYSKQRGKFKPRSTKSICYEKGFDNISVKLKASIDPKDAQVKEYVKFAGSIQKNFRSLFEPEWSKSLAAIENNTFTNCEKANMSGFLAALFMLTPAFLSEQIRLNAADAGMQEATIEKETDRIKEALVRFTSAMTIKFFFSKWIFTRSPDRKLITSDSPVTPSASPYHKNPGYLDFGNFYVALTPHLALFIEPKKKKVPTATLR